MRSIRSIALALSCRRRVTLHDRRRHVPVHRHRGVDRRWEADPDAMRAALDSSQHDAAGLPSKGTDGQVTSTTPVTGCARCSSHLAPQSTPRSPPSVQLQLPVRMGIATGEAELHGRRILRYGAQPHRRVMAAGHGGQILLDGATAALLSGIDLMSLGPRRLRDIAKPVDVFQVRAEGLRAEFPPLKTEDSAPGNLRPRNTTLCRTRDRTR